MQEKMVTKILKVKKVSIVGVIPSFAFQRAKYCALELHRKLPQRFPLPEIVGLLELDWNEKLLEWRQTLGREYWCLRRPVAVFFDDRFIGSDLELIKLTTIGNILVENIPRKNMTLVKKHFRKDYISYLKKTKRIYCYLDICVEGVYVGTLTFQLYSDLLPRTCENFKSLCLGSKGPLLSYKGSRIHRIVKEGWVQGGDIQYKTGGGGFSIFCDPLEDECFAISHDRRGILSMANGGKHCNGSQFFITLKPSKWMDTHYVAFGQLMEGSRVLKLIENIETLYECPLKKVEIKNCGKLDLEDVEDVDATYKEAFLPQKKPKVIETISEQVVRLIMEALTQALAKKERNPDILDDGDVPSKMNLQLYFQGLYSIPENIVEESARYLRNLRRDLFRVLKPSATEIVEVLMYDLLMAVLTRLTTLDDIRETMGHDLYNRMVGGINMEIELCEKPYVRRLVDQIISTAQKMMTLMTKKVAKMKILETKTKLFQKKMQAWVQSFVLQETFIGDNYHISDRPPWNIAEKSPSSENKKNLSKREGKSCCQIEKTDKKNLQKLKDKYPAEDICCLGSKLFYLEEIKLSEYFKSCMYDLKRIPKQEKERMPLLDLIEISRFKLRWMRKKENAVKSKERIYVEKKVEKWLKEVTYVPETSWIKDLLFSKDEIIFNHTEEILYGAMTVGLLEMYYFYETYLKLCGNKKQKLVERIVYVEDSVKSIEEVQDEKEPEKVINKEIEKRTEQKIEKVIEKKIEQKVVEEAKQQFVPPPCTCGHPCCVCENDPSYHEPPPPPSVEEEDVGKKEKEKEKEKEEEEEEEEGEKEKEEEGEEEVVVVTEEEPALEESLHTLFEPPKVEKKPCKSDEELVDIKALLAEKSALKPEEININSFKWLKSYIIEKGCDMKTEFATQVHKWLDGERFNYKGFLSKHSMVTRASLLSLSISLAELITEENHIKKEIKNFIYDLWDLYFDEMFKEATLEFPPEEIEIEMEVEKEKEKEKEREREIEKQLLKEEKKKKEENLEKIIAGVYTEDECKKIISQTPDFDFEQFCRRFNVDLNNDKKEASLLFTNEEAAEEEMLMDETYKGQAYEKEVAKKIEESQEIISEIESNLPLQEEVHLESNQVIPIPEKKKEIVSGAERQNKAENKGAKNKKKPYIIVQELVEEPSESEIRKMPPYVLPSWVKFLTQLTKQALGALAKVSRLPRRLYFLSESEIDFDDKMKEWIEFNTFNPLATKGREIKDYIALHHKSLTNLEDTARSYLKKKKYSELLNRCTRTKSAEIMADEIVIEIIDQVMKAREDTEMLELYVSNFISSAVTSTRRETDIFYPEQLGHNEGSIPETDKASVISKGTFKKL